MKLFVRLMMLVLVVALCGPFFIKGPDGRPLWTINTTVAKVRDWLSDMTSGSVLEQAPVIGAQEVTVYRWRVADGVWQFAAEPPAGVEAETMQIDTRTNAVAFEIPVIKRESGESASQEPAPTVSPEDAMIGPYPSPEATKQLIDDAKALKALAEQRQAVLDEI